MAFTKIATTTAVDAAIAAEATARTTAITTATTPKVFATLALAQTWANAINPPNGTIIWITDLAQPYIVGGGSLMALIPEEIPAQEKDATLPTLSGIPAAWTASVDFTYRCAGVMTFGFQIAKNAAFPAGVLTTEVVANIPAGWRPAGAQNWVDTNTITTGNITANGNITINATGLAIPANRTLNIRGTYLLA